MDPTRRVTRLFAKSNHDQKQKDESEEKRPSESKVLSNICKHNGPSENPNVNEKDKDKDENLVEIVNEISQTDTNPDSFPKKEEEKNTKTDDSQNYTNEYCVLIFLVVFLAGIFVPDVWRKYLMNEFW